MKRDVPPEVMVHYPSPYPPQPQSSAALRWRFAIRAVHHQVRVRLFSWSLIRERRDRKRVLLSLLYHSAWQGLVQNRDSEIQAISSNLVPADAHFLFLLSTSKRMLKGFPWILPSCYSCLRVAATWQPSLRCLGCAELTVPHALCSDSRCWISHFATRPRLLTTHKIVKIRSAMKVESTSDATAFTSRVHAAVQRMQTYSRRRYMARNPEDIQAAVTVREWERCEAMHYSIHIGF